MSGMPEVADGHRRLTKLEGEWLGEERMAPSKFLPDGAMAIGRQEWKVDLGSFFLVGNTEQERDGIVTYRGHGVWSYDEEADGYRLHWFESTGAPPAVFEGGFEGEVLVVTHRGEPMDIQLRFDLSDPDELHTRALIADDDHGWKPLMEGSYRRA